MSDTAKILEIPTLFSFLDRVEAYASSFETSCEFHSLSLEDDILEEIADGLDLGGCTFYRCFPKLKNTNAIQIEPIEDIKVYNQSLDFANDPSLMQQLKNNGTYSFVELDLRYTYLRELYFREFKFEGCNFWGADLQDANFYQAELMKTQFGHTRCEGANLTEANLHGANITKSIFYGANLTRAYFAAVTGTNVDSQACAAHGDLA